MSDVSDGTGLDWVDDRSHEEKRELLLQRAAALATPQRIESEEASLEVVVFAVAGERFAIESRFVCEAIRRPRIARLPSAEPPVFGFASHRGELLTLFDLRALLSLASASADRTPEHLLVVGEREPIGGLLVDEIEGILTLPAPPIPTGTGRGLVRTISSDGLALLDGAAMIQSLS